MPTPDPDTIQDNVSDDLDATIQMAPGAMPQWAVPAAPPEPVALSAANPDSPVPFVFGRRIAQGGMGAILEASDCKLGRTIAVKIMLSEALGTITLAETLRDTGYATGMFGKWHLGDEAEDLPSARGFTEMFIHGGGGIGQSYPGSCGDATSNKYFNPTILHNDKFIKTTGYCTDVFFQQARNWMKSQNKAGKPFFTYIATNTPHSTYIAKPEDAVLYEGKIAN